PVVRRARSRGLLPPGLARLLPHAHLRPERGRVHERAGRGEGDGNLDDAREADDRRPRAHPRHVAPLPPVQGQRPRRDGAVHLDRQTVNPRRAPTMTKRLTVLAAVAVAALAASASASAHAHVSPPVALAKQTQSFTLAVPTEKEGATTTQVVFTPPAGFAIDSFSPSPGWRRTVSQTGSGEDTTITRVTWTGGHVPTAEDSTFQFLAEPQSAKTYTFSVQQTYSDGTVVD